MRGLLWAPPRATVFKPPMRLSWLRRALQHRACACVLCWHWAARQAACRCLASLYFVSSTCPPAAALQRCPRRPQCFLPPSFLFITRIWCLREPLCWSVPALPAEGGGSLPPAPCILYLVPPPLPSARWLAAALAPGEAAALAPGEAAALAPGETAALAPGGAAGSPGSRGRCRRGHEHRDSSSQSFS